jgi:hypothetical protein
MSETKTKIYKSTSDLDRQEIRAVYDGFNAPIAEFDCGKKCAPHNPSGKPFCCDICHAVPAAYKSEWNYLEQLLAGPVRVAFLLFLALLYDLYPNS